MPERDLERHDQIREALQVARLYYLEHQNLKQIASALLMKVPTVSRRLKLARELGFVQVSICEPPDEDFPTEALHARLAPFGVREIVLAGGSENENVGHAAARFFENRADHGNKVVLDGGSTVLAFVAALASRTFERLTIIPVCADPPSDPSSAYEVMVLMSQKFPVKARTLKLPYYRSDLLAPIIERIQQEARQADFLFLGVSSFLKKSNPYDFIMHLGLDPHQLRADYPEIVSFCGYLGLDQHGQEVPIAEFRERMPWSLDFADVREMADESSCRVVVMAAGTDKFEAIVSVLRAGLCDTLIISQQLGHQLLRRKIVP